MKVSKKELALQLGCRRGKINKKKISKGYVQENRRNGELR